MKKKPSNQKEIQSRNDQVCEEHAEEKWIRNVDGLNDDVIGPGPRERERRSPRRQRRKKKEEGTGNGQ